MAAFILVTGVFNLVLGYFLALALADPPFLGLLRRELLAKVWRGLLASRNRRADEFAEDDLPADPRNDMPSIATIRELPEQWARALHDDGLQLNTLVTGIAHYLRLEAAVYREHLLTAEARGRQALAMQEPLTMEQLAADLRFINVEWSRTLRQAAELIEEREARLGPAQESGLQLARFLRDQEGQIVEVDHEIHTLEFRAEGTLGCRRMLGEMQQLVQLAYSLRDEMQCTLAAIYRQEGLLGQLDRKLHHDATTGTLGRLGLEVLFDGTFKTGARPAAAMRISLDQFAKVNRRMGSRTGDLALKAIAHFLKELTAAKCEKSLIARLAGGDFLLVANEATVDELAGLGEHIRQSFEATGFNYQGTDFSLTLTISVAAVAANSGLADILERLEEVRAAAKKAGQNRSARWENGTAILTLPPTIPVAMRMINVETTAA